MAPYNCGKYHSGRQKYIVHIAGQFRPTPLWTHALSRDYQWSDKRMIAIPPTTLSVRHYQGWWYQNKPEFAAGTLVEVRSPIGNPVHSFMHV